MNNSMINDSLVERTPFIIPELSDSKFTSAELADDMDGLQLSFQRAKIPGGGVLQFEMPGDDPENPDYEPTLEGVISLIMPPTPTGPPAASTTTTRRLSASPWMARWATVIPAGSARPVSTIASAATPRGTARRVRTCGCCICFAMAR